MLAPTSVNLACSAAPRVLIAATLASAMKPASSAYLDQILALLFMEEPA